MIFLFKSKGESLRTKQYNQWVKINMKLQNKLEQALKNVDKYIYSNEKYKLKIKFKTEIGSYKKNSNQILHLKFQRE